MFFVIALIVFAFEVNLEESIEGDDLTFRRKTFLTGRNRNGRRGVFQLCFRHLGGNGAFPNQVVKAFLVAFARHGLAAQIGRANGLVRFLRAFGFFAGVLLGV